MGEPAKDACILVKKCAKGKPLHSEDACDAGFVVSLADRIQALSASSGY
jgi:hypothetical protein